MAIEKLLKDALALPREDRVRLADALQQSLDPRDDDDLSEPDWEAAWTVEIERRLREFDDGRTKAISYDEFKNRMRSLFPQP